MFPDSYDIPLLITVYAMVILGGAGSLGGVVLGAIMINVSLEVLRDPNQARWLFYSADPDHARGEDAAVEEARRRARRRSSPSATPSTRSSPPSGRAGTKGAAAGGDAIGRAVQGWVIRPEHDATLIGNYAFVALIAAVLVLTLLQGLLAHRLPRARRSTSPRSCGRTGSSPEPSVTRLIILGALLIVLMNARPQGLLGTARVEIV